MAKFAILRTQKLKSRVAIVRSLKHSFRLQETSNADKEKLNDNEYLDSTSMKDALSKYEDRLPEKVRKNAVHCIEYLITASPEAMQAKSKEQQDEYFKSSLEWLREKHGVENVICAGVHRDETTPHMYAYVVPIDDRSKLNCRAFLGGSKALNEMQSDFYEKVALKCDLERGIEGSKAKHTRIRDYYKNINSKEPISINPDLLKKKLLENNDTYHERVLNIINSVINQYSDKVINKLNNKIKDKDNDINKLNESKRLLEINEEKLRQKFRDKLIENDKLGKEFEHRIYNSISTKDLTSEQIKNITDKINILKTINKLERDKTMKEDAKINNRKKAKEIEISMFD